MVALGGSHGHVAQSQRRRTQSPNSVRHRDEGFQSPQNDIANILDGRVRGLQAEQGMMKIWQQSERHHYRISLPSFKCIVEHKKRIVFTHMCTAECMYQLNLIDDDVVNYKHSRV